MRKRYIWLMCSPIWVSVMCLNLIVDNDSLPKSVKRQPGNKVCPLGQVWDQGSAGLIWVQSDVPHHDAVMGLTWYVRVEVQRVPPAFDV